MDKTYSSEVRWHFLRIFCKNFNECEKFSSLALRLGLCDEVLVSKLKLDLGGCSLDYITTARHMDEFAVRSCFSICKLTKLFKCKLMQDLYQIEIGPFWRLVPWSLLFLAGLYAKMVWRIVAVHRIYKITIHISSRSAASVWRISRQGSAFFCNDSNQGFHALLKALNLAKMYKRYWKTGLWSRIFSPTPEFYITS